MWKVSFVQTSKLTSREPKHKTYVAPDTIDILQVWRIACVNVRAWEIETHDSVVGGCDKFGREAADFFQFTDSSPLKNASIWARAARRFFQILILGFQFTGTK